jgi:TPR repeat protein
MNLPKRLVRCLILLVLAAGAPAILAASDFESGQRAHKSGNYKKAMDLWMPLALRGEARAQHAVARLYEKGQGVEQDFAQALSWYRKAAEQNHADSQYRVAVAYAYGLVSYGKDDKQAMHWLVKAGENGHKKSQKLLARVYQTGELSVTPDEKKARYWADKAAGKR